LTVATELQWADLTEGRTIAWDFTVTDEDMAAFARLSGDVAPLHTDEAFARAKGFEGRVVYGALLSAQLSRLVGMEMPGLHGIFAGMKVSFSNPVYVNRPVHLTAAITDTSEAGGLIVMKVRMTSGDKVVAKATVEAVLRNG
jgi:3-hydroxybutyryl-CoA dehydratase